MQSVKLKEPVSIIIPNYNGELVLSELLYSIRGQDYEDAHLEVIFVDDGSKDHSVDIVRSIYPEAVIICNKRRRGAAFAKNKGIEIANSRWLLFLDNDIVLSKTFLYESKNLILQLKFYLK